MSYANFKPTFWAKEIQKALEAKCKIVNDCWTAFEGECKKGEKAKIIGLGEVTTKEHCLILRHLQIVQSIWILIKRSSSTSRLTILTRHRHVKV